MAQVHGSGTVVRRMFGRLGDVVPVPNLIEIQSKSFNDFAQLDCLPVERRPVGLERVLRDIFPIAYEDTMSLEYVSYELGSWSCTCGKLTGIAQRYSWSCSSCKKSGISRLEAHGECPQCAKKTARYKTCAHCLSRVTVKVPMSIDECRYSGQTFAMPLRIRMQLITWDVDPAGVRVVRDIKEQDIFFGDIPVMADLYEKDNQFFLGDCGTFLINGVDRVVVSQMHRSPGVVFSRSKKTKDVRGRPYFLGRIIPMRGSWLDFEFDSNDYLYVRIDKKKKVLVTTFLQALGVPRDQIISLFYAFETIFIDNGGFYKKLDDALIGQRVEKDMLPQKFERDYVARRLTKQGIASLIKAGIDRLELKSSALIGKVVAVDIIDPATGEIILEQGGMLTEEHCVRLASIKGAISFKVIASPGFVFQPTIAATLAHDTCRSQDDALKELYGRIVSSDGSTRTEMQEKLDALFFNPKTYDLTRVGRVRMNRKLGLTIPEDVMVLTREDIYATIRYLVNLRERGEGELDDIDHLGNRRVRLVGELLGSQVYMGFSRIERIVRERFRMQETQGSLMPQDLLNVKPLGAVLREFFGTGQLSQFMDQTNPLSEIAHKRRLSALGPGGIMKDRATHEIRDVHTSHYGRICPVETPEGQTIGLISSLATYATVNDLGFIESAYRKVEDGSIKKDVVFLDAFEESNKYIAQADAANKSFSKLADDKVLARHDGNFVSVDSSTVGYIDLSPKQLVSVATASIPFLEHDDASRALMGANMQRQAVPLIKCEPPLVGTGMEKEVCRASGAVLIAKKPGVVEYVSAEKIVVRVDRDALATDDDWIANGIETYHLKKFQLSSFNTWIHQTPVVMKGSRVAAGDVLTTGQAMAGGEMALGTNLLVAFMPWHGYNFEDAIVLSKRLVSDDSLSSVYVEEYVVEARDTKLGPEEITRDIPNMSEAALAGLDEDGIVRIGTRVKPGDILVGKVTLKGDVQYSPEEKLLRAIFGEKSREVRDTSLRVEPGDEGTIVDVKVFSRSGIRKDRRYRETVLRHVERVESDYAMHVAELEKMVSEAIITEILKVKQSGKAFTENQLRSKSLTDLAEISVKDSGATERIQRLKETFDTQVRVLSGLKEEKINKLKRSDVLPSGVIKVVKVYIAAKRSISVGDKIAGRHGNKGVVSVIVPREDMPCLADGTPVDVVLNPLGVPSRMNVGQILETILGFAGTALGPQFEKLVQDKKHKEVRRLLETVYGEQFVENYEKAHGAEELQKLAEASAKHGVRFATPVFDGAHFEQDIIPLLNAADLPADGMQRLRDGRTGEYLDQPVTVGTIYIMKLNHMVDDKLHARSVGPYSLITQQPLGGKAQFGGQRLGEMEVWALQAYGAAYTLQEMLTYKSDDINGRHRVYEALVRGDEVPEPGLPESFNVLIKELQSLGLQVDLFRSGKEDVSE